LPAFFVGTADGVLHPVVGPATDLSLPLLLSSDIAAPYKRRPSVVMASGLPWRFSAFFMKVSAAASTPSQVDFDD